MCGLPLLVWCHGRRCEDGGGPVGEKSYELRPEVAVAAPARTADGYEEIVCELRARLSELGAPSPVLVVECYPGVDLAELRSQLVGPLAPAVALVADDYAWEPERLEARIADTLTDDRVFGVMSHYTIDQFFDDELVARARADLRDAPAGLRVVLGTGATLLCEPDLLVYVGLTRWEIQLRQRAGMPSWRADNAGEDQLRKFKRGYFFEWRMADRAKRALFDRMDYVIDANRPGRPTMVDGAGYRSALAEVARRPFRLVPYFDTSVWGGHWMQERFGLDPDAPNFGWAFDGVPEENSIILRFGVTRVEVPAVDVVFREPDALLGPLVHARFGAEFPIRFDFLDTMGGQNLSLQVHPLVEYAQDRFGIHYTQDESYYILDATERSCVYLGVRDGVEKDELMAALRGAQEGGAPFDDARYVNCVPVRRHDHVLIPAGTVHAAGPDTVVLEISATPYIFTFKLWDWGRLGLDGRPRPVHLDHGESNIQMTRDTTFVEHELVSRYSDGPVPREERTGLHRLEFIETRRHWFEDAVELECHGSVNMLNLVEGVSARVEPVDGGPALEVHYAETFIVPASVGRYRVVNTGGGVAAVIQAYVRGAE